MDLNDLIRNHYVLDREDSFQGRSLDRSLWLPAYLPQWSSTAASTARYELTGDLLHLLIEADQEPWCPEFDGSVRVSSLQTGVYAGPVGSTVGQHRFNPSLVVREAQETLRLYTPRFGLFVLRARAVADPACMVSLWMIGYEDVPERSAEICVFEIFGRNVEPSSAAIGMGLHPFGDPTLTDDFEEIGVSIDATEFHEYAAEWTSDRVRFFIDGRQVRVVDQAPQYPMQFMLGIYEFGRTDPKSADYPKRFVIDDFRAYRRSA